MSNMSPGDARSGGPQQVQVPGIATYGQLYPGDRPPPEFDYTFKFAPVDLFQKFLAMLLDGVIYGLIMTASYVPMLIWKKTWMVAFPLAIALVIVVFSIVYLGRRGYTPGMRIMKIKVLRHPEATPIGVGNAIVRYAVLNGPGLVLSVIWYGLLAWSTTRDSLHLKRGWHDLAAQSVVHDLREDAPGRRELEERLAREEAATGGDAHQYVEQQGAAAAYEQQAAYEPPGGGYPAEPQGYEPAYETEQPSYEPAVAGPWTLSFDDGQVLAVTGFGLVGRDPAGKSGESVDHRVAINDPGRTLSKTHASFEARGAELVLIDRHSTNGVSVLRDGVETELPAGKEFALQTGDVVALGDRQVRVHQG